MFTYHDFEQTGPAQTQSGTNSTQVYNAETLYLNEPGDSNIISPSDISQGQIGDCFFLAALGEVALKDPGYFYGMIAGDTGGGESVRLYRDLRGDANDFSTHARFEPYVVSVDNNFSPDAVDNYNISDIVGGVKEIWPQVVEEAYANDLGGYSQITNGGHDSDAMEALTGQIARYQPISKVTTQELASLNNNANSITTFDTKNRNNLPFNLISDHAYMFDGLVHQGGRTFVSLINPWGFDQPNLVPVTQLSQGFLGITHGTV